MSECPKVLWESKDGSCKLVQQDAMSVDLLVLENGEWVEHDFVDGSFAQVLIDLHARAEKAEAALRRIEHRVCIAGTDRGDEGILRVIREALQEKNPCP